MNIEDCVISEKIKLGISACNFGSQVRWNLRGWNRLAALNRTKQDYVFTPVCPEVLSGLGAPRPPIRLVKGNGYDFWKGTARIKNRKGQDVSGQIKTGAGHAMDIILQVDIDAFLFMEGSPTCGVYRTTLKDKRLGKPPGVFGARLLEENIFLIPVLDLESPWKWWDWQRRLHAFVWLRKKEIQTKKEIYDIWHHLKFICQEVDRPKANEIGQAMANMPKKLNKAFIESWRTSVLHLIRQPSHLRRIIASLTKHYAHYRKHFGYKVTEVDVPSTWEGKRKFVESLQKFERKAFDSGYLFAGHPVVYRPPRYA